MNPVPVQKANSRFLVHWSPDTAQIIEANLLGEGSLVGKQHLWFGPIEGKYWPHSTEKMYHKTCVFENKESAKAHIITAYEASIVELVNKINLVKDEY